MKLAVGPGALAFPGLEYRADCAPQLLCHVLGKRRAERPLHFAAVLFRNAPEIGRVELRVQFDSLRLLLQFEDFLEAFVRQTKYDIGVHVNESPV